MQKEIKHTFYFSQTPQEVWEYLTKPELRAEAEPIREIRDRDLKEEVKKPLRKR